MYKRFLYFLVLLFFIPSCYAIHVSAQTSSNKVYALGFQLNGKDYGGAGTKYSHGDLPAGMYTFGIRVGGLVIGAKDIRCPTKKSQSVMLNRNTTAILHYNERSQSCIAQIYSR